MTGGLVERISGAGYREVELEGRLCAANKEQRFAARIVREGKAKLAGQDAYFTVVDVSNVDQLRVAPGSVEVRLMRQDIRLAKTQRSRPRLRGQ